MNYSIDRPQSGLLDSEEVDKLQNALEHEDGVMTKQYGRNDGAGRKPKLPYGISPEMTSLESLQGARNLQLLKGEVYHYHSKVIMKEAQTGGQHVWHQDYGYKCENGCMFPDMGSVWVAVDKATRENWCVQILAWSHLLGRIDHVKVGEQVGADMDGEEHAKKFCDLLFCVLNPGDALFLYSNVLHSSGQNSSDKRRWAFLVAFNWADNYPVIQDHHSSYTQLHKVANSEIKECTTDTDMSGKDFFLGPKADISLGKISQKS